MSVAIETLLKFYLDRSIRTFIKGVASWTMASQDLLTRVLKITDKTSGRDRLCRQVAYCVMVYMLLMANLLMQCRLVQYGSKFISWLLEQGTLTPDLIKKLRELESFISTARKCEYCILAVVVCQHAV